MSRKLAFCAVSVLVLMALVVSAQQSQPTAIPAAGQTIVDSERMWTVPMIGGTVHREEYELSHKSEKLAKELATAKGEEREKIRDKLTDTLGKQFDVRQKRHEAEIAALEAQLKKLKDIVQKRQENRKEIISKRMEHLVRNAEGLGW
jgi:hypothetical protein